MDANALAENALVGWRAKVADAIAEPVEKRTPLSASRTRAVIGALFFALSVYYVIGTAQRVVRELRE